MTEVIYNDTLAVFELWVNGVFTKSAKTWKYPLDTGGKMRKRDFLAEVRRVFG